MQPQDENIIRAIRIAKLIDAQREGDDLNATEQLELEQWAAGHRGLYESLLNREYVLSAVNELRTFEDPQRIQTILSSTMLVQHDDEVKSSPGRLNIKVWLRYAAVLIPLVAVCAAYLWNYFGSQGDRELLQGNTKVVVPAIERAILTLNDGSIITLHEKPSGEIARQGSTIIRKSASGALVYKNDGNSKGASYDNSLRIPRGGFFELNLSDGSRVWLNAETVIDFPAAFSDTNRVVSVSGEAYFEVAHNARAPFRVKINDGVEVEVLGTRFNVLAYANGSQTTLLEGSVKLTKKNHNNSQSSVLLSPSQRGLYDPLSGGLQVSVADTADVMAWRKGVFNFGVRPLRDVMQDISRWYDVEVEYRRTLPELQLWGSIDRQIEFRKLLEFLGKSGLNYRMEGERKIVIM